MYDNVSSFGEAGLLPLRAKSVFREYRARVLSNKVSSRADIRRYTCWSKVLPASPWSECAPVLLLVDIFRFALMH